MSKNNSAMWRVINPQCEKDFKNKNFKKGKKISITMVGARIYLA